MHIIFRSHLSFKKQLKKYPFILILILALSNSSYSILKAEELHAFPGTVVFNAIQGKTLNEERSIFTYTSSDGNLNWSLTKGASWITTDIQSGYNEDVIKVGVNTNGLSAGVYNGNIVITAPQSTAPPVVIQVSLIINPDIPVEITTWKDSYAGAMSVSVDDGQPSGFDALQANGFSGTYVMIGTSPPSFYTDYYNAGMELGCHTVNHTCDVATSDDFRYVELEPNIQALCADTPEPCSDVISFVWPCGYTNYREQAIAADYFLSSRGYNINELEDATPEDFMNLKSFNSHEHTPYPPSDLKTVVDAAVAQKKWFNLVLHNFSNDDGAITYAHSQDIWVASIGEVIKYILQRNRLILTSYSASPDLISFNVSRLQVPSSSYRSFENAFGANDMVTLQIDVDDSKVIDNVLINGTITPYTTRSINGNTVILVNIKPYPSTSKNVQIVFNGSITYLTVTGVTAYDKVYDGTTSASLNTTNATLSGVVSGDDVSLVTSGATGNFISKNAGTEIQVTTSGFSLSGLDAGKYFLVQPVAMADITTAGLSISGLAVNDKTYDGTTSAVLDDEYAYLNGVQSGDYVTIISNNATGTFEDKDVGYDILVTTQGFVLGGSGAYNYHLTQPVTSGNIFPAELEISRVIAYDKVYDRTTLVTLNTGKADLSGLIDGDAISLNTSGVTGHFIDKDAGNSKSVITSGFTISGSDVDNYYLTQPTLFADIKPAELTIENVTAYNRTYDGTTYATLYADEAYLVDVLGSDDVYLNFSDAFGDFENKNVGNNKTVSTYGFYLEGYDADNYELSFPVTYADITKAVLSIAGLHALDKEYDGTVSAVLDASGAYLSGVFGNDDVDINSSAAVGLFYTPDVGADKTVTASGFSLDGTDQANYVLTQPVASASITGKELTVNNIFAADKAYNGTTNAVIITENASLEGILPGDAVILEKGVITGTFADKNVGLLKPVTISGFTLSGVDAPNYFLNQPTAVADITSIGLSVIGLSAVNRIYDGTVKVNIDDSGAQLEGEIDGDNVFPVFSGAEGTLLDKNAGLSKEVLISGVTLSGTDAQNYFLNQPESTVDISPATLSVTGIIAETKSYDGTTSAVMNFDNASLLGLYGIDRVKLDVSGATGRYETKDVGLAKKVIVTGCFITGLDAYNYKLPLQIQIFNGGITKASLTVTGLTALNKIYDGDVSATVNLSKASLSGIFGLDTVGLNTDNVTSSFEDKNVGNGKQIITAGYVLEGDDSANYDIENQPDLKADIVAKSVTISGVVAENKIYDGTKSADINLDNLVVSDIIGADDIVATTALAQGSFEQKDAGKNIQVLVTGITLGGADGGNYIVIQPVLSADILAKPLIVTAKDTTKSYGMNLTFNGNEYIADGLVIGDSLPLLEFQSDGIPDSAEVGSYVLNISGATSDNYSYVYHPGILMVKKAQLTIKADDKSKDYGSENPVFTLSYSEPNIDKLESDEDTLPVATTAASDSSKPGIYNIVLSGGYFKNYVLKLENGKLEILKAKLIVKADNKEKSYGEANPELSVSYSGFVLGQNLANLEELPSVETDAQVESDVGNYDIVVGGAKDDNYTFTYISGTLTIEKADQIITFSKVPDGLRMTQQYYLRASATSGLETSFEVSNPEVGDLHGDILVIKEAGKLQITAKQSGNYNWNPAPDATQSIVTRPTFENITSLFTPNNDGINDYWYIPDLQEYGDVKVTVFNRFGKKVYQSDGYKNDWNGTFNGENLPSASYYYVIISSKKGIIKGVVNIVR